MKNILIALVALIAGPFLTLEGYKEYTFHQKLAKEGVEVPGLPMEGHTSGRRKSRSYLLSVMYPVKNGKPVTKEFKVTSSYYKSIGSDGKITVDSVPVKYLPSDPNQAMIVGGSTDSELFLWVGPILAVAGFGYLIYRMRNRGQNA